MLTQDQIKAALSDRNLQVVAQRAGVSYGTILNIARGRTKASNLVRRALTDYLLHGAATSADQEG